jgi:hypothetical protein
MLKRGIILIDQALGDNGKSNFINSPSTEDIIDFPLQNIPDPPLTMGATHIEGQWIDRTSCCFHPSQDIPNLRTVSVGYDDIVTCFDQIDNVFGGVMAVIDLIRNIPHLILA